MFQIKELHCKEGSQYSSVHCTTLESRLPDDGGNKGPDRSCLLGMFEIRGELIGESS